MKKGDIIQKGRVLEVGHKVFGNLDTQHQAEQVDISSIYGKHFGTRVDVDPDNNGKLALFTTEEVILTEEARVNWVVDDEAGIKYMEGDGYAILDLKEEGDNWVVVQEAEPEYQSSVEHLSDEELRNSIEALRADRLKKPKVARTRVSVKKEKLTPAQKKMQDTLKNLDPEKKAELMKKLGLVD